MRKELLIGCGKNKNKKISLRGEKDWNNLTTLDMNPSVNPDLIWDLNNTPYPFSENEFDEIHAYEVLEHLGSLGDYLSFFKQFEELWRILKPDGFLIGTSPALQSRWLLGDPGHTRVISKETLTFLSQSAYLQIDSGSPMTDYRFCYKGDFEVSGKIEGETFIYILRALKLR